jgi:hypothetical protein
MRERIVVSPGGFESMNNGPSPRYDSIPETPQRVALLTRAADRRAGGSEESRDGMRTITVTNEESEQARKFDETQISE